MSLLSLNSSNALLNKCKKELDELRRCSIHPDYDFILFNIVVGMNHIFEWYLKEKNLETSKKLDCINNFNPFESPYDVSGDFKKLYKKLANFPATNKFQETIRKLCNKAKHFKQKPLEKQNKNFTSVFGAAHMTCGSSEAVCGGFDHYCYSVDINGVEHKLEILLEAQINKWSRFLENV